MAQNYNYKGHCVSVFFMREQYNYAKKSWRAYDNLDNGVMLLIAQSRISLKECREKARAYIDNLKTP